jgi:NAD(P)-dependent dehydrogenase (short-subunit alcohol dehydrogenase family)
MVKERLQQVALVTGGGRGIGKEIVRGLRNRGMYVAAVARTKEELAEVAKETGCFPIVADVSKKEDVQRVFDEVCLALAAFVMYGGPLRL